MQPDGSVQDNTYTLTPSINRLMSEGIKLTAYHTYKVCAPSRAAILTGRYPWGVGYYDMKGPEAIPLGFKLVANLLADAGYETHAIVRHASSRQRALPEPGWLHSACPPSPPNG